MDVDNRGPVLIGLFMFALSAAAILIAMNSDKKSRTVYDKYLHSKPRDGDNT